MLSLDTSRSKTQGAQPSDPDIRLGFGETAAGRSFFFAASLEHEHMQYCAPLVCLVSGQAHK
jgi:hypothetical protein